MKFLVLVMASVCLVPRLACAQRDQPENFIRFAFKVDEKVLPCEPVGFTLKLHDQTIVPEQESGGFRVPRQFLASSGKWASDDKAGVSILCGIYRLEFEMHPALITGGDWEAGVRYPPAWIELAYTHGIEQGNWLSYLSMECNGCDPGVVTYRSHSEIPEGMVARLQREQTTATGKSARDIAYALAVFHAEYSRNRDSLVGVLADCLGRPRESPEDDICDSDLLTYVVNLYWRGDDDLLPILLRDADQRRDVIGDIGAFYADLFDRRPQVTIASLENLTLGKQQQVCRLAGDLELHLGPQKLGRVSQNLHSIGSDVAKRCLATIQAAAR